MSTNRPPSCDLPPEFYWAKLKPCPACGRSATLSDKRVRCFNPTCWIDGPPNDPHGKKWNSIPRRAEVLELLRLVDSLRSTQSKSEESPNSLHAAYKCADKLRKEIGE